MVYSPYIVSLEAFAPPGQSSETKGIMAVRTKAEWWSTNHDLHSTVAEGPLEAGVHYAVYQFADQGKLDAAMKDEVLKPLIADFDKNWPAGVTRSRDELTLAEERSA